MTHKQARFFLGPLLLAAVVGVFLADAAMGRPLLTEIVIVLLGVVALFEFAAITGMPGAVRGALMVTGAAVMVSFAQEYEYPGSRIPVIAACVLVPFLVVMCLRWGSGVVKRDDLVVL
ncbi:MAG: hypothetical protein VCA35_17270, partial [Roseibacillus sp.]